MNGNWFHFGTFGTFANQRQIYQNPGEGCVSEWESKGGVHWIDWESKWAVHWMGLRTCCRSFSRAPASACCVPLQRPVRTCGREVVPQFIIFFVPQTRGPILILQRAEVSRRFVCNLPLKYICTAVSSSSSARLSLPRACPCFFTLYHFSFFVSCSSSSARLSLLRACPRKKTKRTVFFSLFTLYDIIFFCL